MLINPSPTTLLVMWLSGCAAGGVGGGGQQRAGQGTRCPQRTCLAQVLQHGRTARPPRPGPTAAAAWAAPALQAGAKSHPPLPTAARSPPPRGQGLLP